MSDWDKVETTLFEGSDAASSSSRPPRSQAGQPIKARSVQPTPKPVLGACGAARGGLSLGYRKPNHGAGAWIVRLIQSGRRVENRRSGADDPAAVHGLSYGQAVAAAIAWAATPAALGPTGQAFPPLTIRSAVADYVGDRKKRDVQHGRNAETRLAKWLLADDRLADRALPEIDESDLATWAKAVAATAPATVGRLFNDVKAALNRVHDIHHRALPAG